MSRGRLHLDSKNRVYLTQYLPDYKIDSFRVTTKGDKIILEPMVEIPAREMWLHQNPKALKSVNEGIKDAEEGRLHSLGSFAEFANENLEEDEI